MGGKPGWSSRCGYAGVACVLIHCVPVISMERKIDLIAFGSCFPLTEFVKDGLVQG